MARMSEFTDYAQGTPCWVELSVGDLAGALDFYRAVFGWDFDEPAADRDSYTVARVRGKAVAGIFVPGLPGVPTVWSTYLAADDAEATAAAITTHGGQLITGIMDLPGNGRIVIAADPTGGVFGVFAGGMGAELANEPATPIWNELRTKDTATARAFYADVFGLAISAPFDDEADYTSIDVAGHEVGGIGVLDTDDPPHWMTYFGVADTDATAAAVLAAGGHVERAPYDTPYGRMARCADPQGARFRLLSVSAGG